MDPQIRVEDDQIIESRENRTNEIEHDLIPDNTVTVFLKVNGRVFAVGRTIDPISQSMDDEDLALQEKRVDSITARVKNTIRHKLANRPYPKAKFED